MADKFDPYAEWLGIKDAQRPLTNYQLLGLVPFESHAEKIEGNAQQQLAKLAQFTKGEQALLAKRIAFEIKSASTCLLNPATKASYDAGMGASKSLVSGTQPTHPAEATKGKENASRPLTPAVPTEPSAAGSASRPSTHTENGSAFLLQD